MHAVSKRPKRQPGRPTTRLAKQGIRRMQEMLEQKAEQLSAVIPCSGPVRSCSALLFRQVLQVLRAFCRFFSPPAPIYRDLQGPLRGWPVANARRSSPNGTRVIWFVRSPEMSCGSCPGGDGDSFVQSDTHGVPLRSFVPLNTNAYFQDCPTGSGVAGSPLHPHN